MDLRHAWRAIHSLRYLCEKYDVFAEDPCFKYVMEVLREFARERSREHTRMVLGLEGGR